MAVVPDKAELVWAQPQIVGESPSRRSGHSLTICGQNAFLFGGCDQRKPPGPNNEMFLLKLTSGEFEWKRLKIDGLSPKPRWRHTATLWEKNIVVFGGFHSSNTRFNDVWIFDTVSRTWSAPIENTSEFTPRGNHITKKTGLGLTAPPPRGAHSASLIDGKIYIFGGYGGTGYCRKDFKDMHYLDLVSMTWTKVNTKGKSPDERSGHSASVVGKKIFVYGGWNTETQFNDLYVYNTESATWEDEVGTFQVPRWNHSACAVEAIPNVKIFLFGGSGGNLEEMKKLQGKYSNDVAVLDTGNKHWSVPDIVGLPPLPRSDTEIIYDSKGSRLILFGGWANRWYGDVFTLDVVSIVGPPYAITDIQPTMGPSTGGTLCRIAGIDFVNTPQVTVRFISRKGNVDQVGTYVSPTELTCETPDFSKFGSGEVDVRVALKGDSFTTTFQKFTFFSVAEAKSCVAFGPGLLEGCASAIPISFIIVSRDGLKSVRQTGGDQYTVTVKDKQGVSLDQKDIEVLDNSDGTYLVTYTAPNSGQYTVDVQFEGTFGGSKGPIAGSPFNVSFDDGVSKSNNLMEGDLFLNKIKSDISDLNLFCTNTTRALKTKIVEEDIAPLLVVKEQLFAISDRKDEVDLTVDVVRVACKYLANIGKTTVNKYIEQLDGVDHSWKHIQESVPAIKAAIAPYVKAHGQKAKIDLAEYEEKVTAFVATHSKMLFWSANAGADGATKSINEGHKLLAEEKNNCVKFKNLARVMEFPDLIDESTKMLNKVESDLIQFRNLWDVAAQVNVYITESKDQLWADVAPSEMEDEGKRLQKVVKGLHKDVRTSDAYKGLDTMTKDFVNTCPLIAALKHKSMRPRHWAHLMEITKKSFTQPNDDPNFKLQQLIDLKLYEFVTDIEDICDQAMKEEKMEVALAKLEENWSGVEFFLERYAPNDPNDLINIVKMKEEDFEAMEADQLTCQTMLASRYDTFITQVTSWNHALGTIAEVMILFGEIQRSWGYLEPLFIKSEEVRKELPEDAMRFQKIDVEVRVILTECERVMNIKAATTAPGLIGKLEKCQKDLDLCKKSLAEFLDGKRRQFPRFYFVSEADLLDILSNGNAPKKIMKHITKVFLATDRLTLDESIPGTLLANVWVAGVGQEQVAFEPPVALEGKVEVYLMTVHEAMKSTIQKNAERCLARYPTQSREDWLMNKDAKGKPTDPAQLSLLISAIYYSREVDTVFDEMQMGQKDSLRNYNKKQIDQLNGLIRLTRTNLSKGDRTRVMVLITLDAHGRDIIQRLLLEKVETKTAFQWISQLKHRWDIDVKNAAMIHICDARFEYGLEYLGNGPRLVITALTDRIYVTATQALNLKMGCAPAGPAGTGKTETTKDLANALGKVCYVFNCSPEMDYRSMGDIFKGLSASGSWGCFDEFNRLVPEVLSVCTVQFKAVCDAIRRKELTVVIEGDRVACDWTCGGFITMNPGYLGRSELPEGLKALFRPMTVMVPDLVLICENMLMAEGFQMAKVLASKFFGLYNLLGDLLSKQPHYDWGLRAVKSVLVVAGSFLRAEPDLGEEELLMRALRDMNTPKIVGQDEIIFSGLLGDLFPGINPPRKSDPALEIAVREAALNSKLWPDPYFLLKCVQLDELMAIRHCTFIMGPPGSGKSQCWRNLAKAKKLKASNIKDLDPKAISTEQLYGYVTLATREWKDGLLSVAMRDLGVIEDELPKWIILDGDLDANWIESMNSVMDDNKMLTLASNERIPLKHYMKMIFEIRNLRFATPATVSRAGIIYISTDKGTQWRNLISAWVQKREEPEHVKLAILELFERYCPVILNWMKKNTSPIVPVEGQTMIQSLIFMLEGLITNELLVGPGLLDQKDVVKNLEPTFVFACIWAFGSSLAEKDGEDYRKIFSDYWRAEFKNVKIPPRESVFDYFLDQATGQFDLWKNNPSFKTIDYDSKTPMGEVTVPTPETTSVTYWLDILVAKNLPCMLVGSAGCGKTQLINGMLAKLNPEHMLFTTVNFNFYTGSEALRANLEGPLEKKTGQNYGPPGNASMIFFMDDLNLPQVDKYDTQSAIELARQYINYGHWYDPFNPAKGYKSIAKCQYLACMNPTAGSFTINPRLQRQFITFAISFPGPASLLAIYETFLNGHLKNFSPNVQKESSNIIASALNLHSQVAKTFRKSAVNFHYEFNIRHMSNVFQGLLVSKPEKFEEPEKFVALWLHESERVYSDRLVNTENIKQYSQIASSTVKTKFGSYNMAKYFATENADPLIFCHFADNIQDKIYEQVTDIKKLSTILNDALAEYNESYAAMNLVLFGDAMKHICKICRIILNSGGHALLVGVGGSGKQSLSRLSAFICGYETFQLTITETYGVNDLKDDLKGMYNKAGLKEIGINFLFTDSQITNERFLVYLNDLLASGDIPDLFPSDEKDTIVNAVTSRVKAMGIDPNRSNCWKYFISEIKKNLHMSLCFSPVGEDFRIRSLRFPALVNCTVIDWFQPWPEDALYSVGKQFLAEIDLGSDKVRAAIEKFMPYSFQTVNKASKQFLLVDRRYCYTTPKSYLELLKLYKLLLEKKRDQSKKAINRLTNGLTKLRETGAVVATIEADLKILLVEAEEKRVTSEGIAAKVAIEKATVEKATAEANVEAAICEKIKIDVSAQQKSCTEDLAQAEPMVRAALAALDALEKKDLGNCKTMNTPPKGVDDVFAAVMSLFANVFLTGEIVKKSGEIKDASWKSAKKELLGNVNEFLDNLKGFTAYVDDNRVPLANWKFVKNYLQLEHFNPDQIKTGNPAAGGLCIWVISIVKYYEIVVTVEPKKIALAKANAELSAAAEKLAKVQAHCAELQANLDKLDVEFNAANNAKQAAINQVETGSKKLDLAQRLTKALADENVRWGINVEQLTADAELLVGDVLIASTFISYIGPFTKRFRDDLILKQWLPFLLKAVEGGDSVPMSPDPNPLNILTNDAEIAGWNQQTLPSDRVSVENGVIVTNSARWPLLIDPQLQAIAWIREKEKDRKLEICRLGQNTLFRKLEFAMQEGNSILIENMGERIDPNLNPIIQRATVKRGRKLVVMLGGKECELHPNFRLFLHTKLSNPHYPPEVQAECTLVNFTVTETGLEDQLLTLVMRKERPDLAEQKSMLIQQQNGFKIKIKELEDNILSRLAAAEGDITEDVELIEGLEDTKRISIEINEKVKIAKITTDSINITSEKYRFVAARGSLLFFLMNNLYKIHSYYIYSLNAFVVIFLRGIDLVTEKHEDTTATKGGSTRISALKKAMKTIVATERFGWNHDVLLASRTPRPETTPTIAAPEKQLSDEELKERCNTLTHSITGVVFNYVSRGLFEQDKIIVAAQLCFKILIQINKLTPENLEVFVSGRQNPDPGNMGPLGEWMAEVMWQKVKALEKCKSLSNIGEEMQANGEQWLAWFNLEKPEDAKMPGEAHKLESLYQLMILRALRPDRVVKMLKSYVALNLGEEFVSQLPFNMADAYTETSASTPVFFVLFPGVDPTVWVEGLGEKLGITTANGKFKNISMGQGQEAPAQASLTKFAKEGGWIMLQNCHLMQSWLPTLERSLEVCSETAHKDFRCYISAEPPPFAYLKNIPESLMQSCIKVANEAPADLKSNLRRSWANFTQERIDECPKSDEFKGTLFTVCLYHGLILGRRRFGQQGWSRKYSFNTGDLTVCSNVLFEYIKDNPNVPWDDLRYIFGEIMYGGHITDYWDRRTNNVYLEVLLTPKIFDKKDIIAGFSVCDAKGSHADFAAHIEAKLPIETPQLFGMHPNAEIGYLTATIDRVFSTIVMMDQGGAGKGSGGANVIRSTLEDILTRLPKEFFMIELEERADALMKSDAGPFVVVALQECGRMNELLNFMKKTLSDLRLGLDGSLNMSDSMEDLSEALSLNQVPGRNPFHRCSWEKLAWFSNKNIVSWFSDLLARVEQLNKWTSTFVLPYSMWLPGLFNPTAFLTAVMQITARRTHQPLDRMTTEAHVSTYITPSECVGYPTDGAYVHGMFMEGARWMSGDDAGEVTVIGTTKTQGYVTDSRLKELLAPMPVMYIKAVDINPSWIPQAVGYLRARKDIYECPVYTTTFRGPTYCFLATLVTKDPTSKWVLAGVALIMQDDL